MPMQKKDVILLFASGYCLYTKLNSSLPQQVFVVRHPIDTLLRKLECSEEDCIDDAGAGHGDTEPSIHSSIKKLYLRSGLLVLAADEAVALVDALRRVDWKDLAHVSHSSLWSDDVYHSRKPS